MASIELPLPESLDHATLSRWGDQIVKQLVGAVIELQSSGGGETPPVGWDDITGKPSLLQLGNTASTAAAGNHSHGVEGVTGLQAALDGKQASGSYASATHTHPVSQVDGLQTALDGKASSADLTALTARVAALEV